MATASPKRGEQLETDLVTEPQTWRSWYCEGSTESTTVHPFEGECLTVGICRWIADDAVGNQTVTRVSAYFSWLRESSSSRIWYCLPSSPALPKWLGLTKKASVECSWNPQPHLKHGSAYRQNRPTKLDKIKNLHIDTRAGPVRGASPFVV